MTHARPEPATPPDLDDRSSEELRALKRECRETIELPASTDVKLPAEGEQADRLTTIRTIDQILLRRGDL